MKLPPPDRIPQNVAGMAILPIESYTVASYGPQPDGRPPQTEVHLVIRVRGLPEPLVMRLKSADAADTLIAALQRHRFDIWPSGREQEESQP
jgi:hypothetical protein